MSQPEMTFFIITLLAESILLVLGWNLSEHTVVTVVGKCLLFLPVQQGSSFGPSVV